MAKYRILVVDDNPEIRSTVQCILDNPEFELSFAENGDEGLQKARSWEPHLILLDLHMPVMTGVTMYGHLKNDKRTANTRVLVMTASDDESQVLRQLVMQVGANDFMNKPFTPAELLPRVTTLLSLKTQKPTRPEGPIVRAGNIKINKDSKQVWVNGNPIKAGQRGIGDTLFHLLCALVENKDGLTKKQLLDLVWPGGDSPQAVDTAFTRLRKLLGRDDLIVHIDGVYRLAR